MGRGPSVEKHWSRKFERFDVTLNIAKEKAVVEWPLGTPLDKKLKKYWIRIPSDAGWL
jgi:hypothetical protein